MPRKPRACRAKDISRCPVHGHTYAAGLIQKALESTRVSVNDRIKLAEMNERTKADRNLKQVPLGVAVEYEDGTSEVFVGDSTDPYFASDYRFVSTTRGVAIEGYSFDAASNNDEWDPISIGRNSTSQFMNEFHASTGTKLAVSEGDPEGDTTSLDDRVIKHLVVI